MISVLLATPSQWALQYFDLSGAMQVQAAFAHFLGALDMGGPPRHFWKEIHPFDGDCKGKDGQQGGIFARL